MAPTVEEIASEALKAVDRVIRNNIQVETCPVKKQKAEWKKEKVVQELAVKLGIVGPKEVK